MLATIWSRIAVASRSSSPIRLSTGQNRAIDGLHERGFEAAGSGIEQQDDHITAFSSLVSEVVSHGRVHHHYGSRLHSIGIARNVQPGLPRDNVVRRIESGVNPAPPRVSVLQFRQ